MATPVAPGPTVVLLVEDSVADARLVTELLHRGWNGPGLTVTHVERLAAACSRLDEAQLSCVLLDLSLPDAAGLEGLASILALAPEVAVVVLTGREDSGMALEALQAGAQDYLLKGQLDPQQLARAVRYAIERKRAEVALAHQALHDSLTGLPNRTLLNDRLTQALARSQRSETSLAVLFLDIDRFKVINDSRGHSVGDELLRAIAGRLQATVRAGDTAARFGGDEFVIVTESVGPDDSLTVLSQRIATAVAEPMTLGGTDLVVNVSIGVAVARPGDDAESLLRDADAAMYRAKEQGRNRCVVFDASMRAQATERLEGEHALRLAMERDELSVYYQPIVELTSGQVVGVEALARWHHPEKGVILPDEFIPLAEETGLIVPLGPEVLRQACRDVAAWQRHQPPGAPLSAAVNLSARQLLAPDLAAVVEDALSTSGLEPGLLCLEITESVLLGDADKSLQPLKALQALQAAGVRIGVDDFGTGYSSLTYLKCFPVDTLKIDKSFVDGLGGVGSDQGDRAIVAGIIDLAHAFGLTTVAEGVETVEQLDQLRALGCEQAQGYYLSRPLPASEMAEWLIASAAASAAHAVTAPVPSTPTKRILLVEDDRSLRAMLRLLAEDCDDITVVGEAGDGREAVALARHYQPDLILLDLAMPGMGGLEALPLLLAVAPEAKIVVLSGLDPHEVADKARDKGAVGYFNKGDDPTPLIDYLGWLLAPAG